MGSFSHSVGEVLTRVMKHLMVPVPPQETGRHIVHFSPIGDEYLVAIFPVVVGKFLLAEDSHIRNNRRPNPERHAEGISFKTALSWSPQVYLKNLETKGDVSPRRRK